LGAPRRNLNARAPSIRHPRTNLALSATEVALRSPPVRPVRHVHLHCAVIDGVHTTDEHGTPRFHFLPALTPTDIHWVCATVATPVCNLLRRRGLLRDRADDKDDGVRLAPSTALDACRQAALSRGRFERLDAKGRAQQQLFPDEPTFSRSKKSPWAVEVDGFSVEAGVHFGALDRKGRERLLHYLLRPPIATERFSILRDGSVAYRTSVP
jgi:hypothetical protein